MLILCQHKLYKQPAEGQRPDMYVAHSNNALKRTACWYPVVYVAHIKYQSAVEKEMRMNGWNRNIGEGRRDGKGLRNK